MANYESKYDNIDGNIREKAIRDKRCKPEWINILYRDDINKQNIINSLNVNYLYDKNYIDDNDIHMYLEKCSINERTDIVNELAKNYQNHKNNIQKYKYKLTISVDTLLLFENNIKILDIRPKIIDNGKLQRKILYNYENYIKLDNDILENVITNLYRYGYKLCNEKIIDIFSMMNIKMLEKYWYIFCNTDESILFSKMHELEKYPEFKYPKIVKKMNDKKFLIKKYILTKQYIPLHNIIDKKINAYEYIDEILRHKDINVFVIFYEKTNFENMKQLICNYLNDENNYISNPWFTLFLINVKKGINEQTDNIYLFDKKIVSHYSFEKIVLDEKDINKCKKLKNILEIAGKYKQSFGNMNPKISSIKFELHKNLLPYIKNKLVYLPSKFSHILNLDDKNIYIYNNDFLLFLGNIKILKKVDI